MAITAPSAFWELANTSDSVGSATLTNNNSLTFGAGKVGDCGQFVNSSSRYLSRGDESLFDVGTKASWHFWVRPNGTTNDRSVCAKGTWGGTLCWAFDGYLDEIYVRIGDAGQRGYKASVFSVSTWTHIVITYDGGGATNADKLKLYVNGSSVSFDGFVGTIPTTVPTDSGEFNIGRAVNLGRVFDGDIDEAGLWKGYVLTSTEVSDLYNGGSGNALSNWYTPPVSTARNILLTGVGG